MTAMNRRSFLGAAATAGTGIRLGALPASGAAAENVNRGVPRPYTLPAGATAADSFPCGTGYGNGVYDLTVTGPNRFLCRFRGDAAEPGRYLAVSTSYAVESHTGKLALWFTLTNSGSSAVQVTITSHAYRSDGPWNYTVPAGGSTRDYFNAVAYTDGWYDFTVTTSADATWSQRFTGHLETGAPSVTG
ncbi:exported hypothetical protein [Actinacidiphila bryophytorum]|uniref:Bacterial phospholipase C C-terminal domain-containing protein n=2 Tax=Actinacidiphila bryophytorum TaxID=1436133 RepID=A0A9W4E4N4_9ACTN|nr:exported hypothetical protein [Actinacidiphila bryophytorum]